MKRAKQTWNASTDLGGNVFLGHSSISTKGTLSPLDGHEIRQRVSTRVHGLRTISDYVESKGR